MPYIMPEVMMNIMRDISFISTKCHHRWLIATNVEG